MARHDVNQEIEIKLPVANLAKIRNQLKQLRAREIVPRTYELNTLYDTPSQNLTRRRQLIRLRIERPGAGLGKQGPLGTQDVILTYKGPTRSLRSSEISSRKRESKARFKIREEFEVAVSDGDRMAAILRAMGLRPAFRYEKFRTTYVLPRLRGLKVELDETPVGIYLELEGPPVAIGRAARLLGYTESDYLNESYGALYLADCRRRGKIPTDMLFLPTKKLR